MKAIIIGHDSLNKGMYSNVANLHEYDFFRKMQVELEGFADVFTHDPSITGYKQRMQNTATKLDNYSLVLELHFNGFNGKAHGCEALYFHSNKQGKQLAEDFCSDVFKSMGIRNRGAKPLSTPNQRGYWAVASPKPTTLILEPFFGDNIMDVMKFRQNEFIDIIKMLHNINWDNDPKTEKRI